MTDVKEAWVRAGARMIIKRGLINAGLAFGKKDEISEKELFNLALRHRHYVREAALSWKMQAEDLDHLTSLEVILFHRQAELVIKILRAAA